MNEHAAAAEMATAAGELLLRLRTTASGDELKARGDRRSHELLMAELAQRYPDDYDGIVANIPAHCRTPLHAYFLWNYQILAKCPFTQAQEKTVVDAGNEYMANRESPPVAGKFVSDPRCNSKDIEAVIALALQRTRPLRKRTRMPCARYSEGQRMRSRTSASSTVSRSARRLMVVLEISISSNGCLGRASRCSTSISARTSTRTPLRLDRILTRKIPI